MAQIQGTNISAPVVPFDTNDIFASHIALYGKGGHRTVNNLTEKYNIPFLRREEGMTVYVISENKRYRLVSIGSDGVPTTSADWVEEEIQTIQQATETEDGITQLATYEEFENGQDTGSTGATLFVRPSHIKQFIEDNITLIEQSVNNNKIIDITWDGLIFKLTFKTAIDGQLYRITDYQTKYFQSETHEYKESLEIEPLIIRTVWNENLNSFQIYKQAISEKYTGDLIYYDVFYSEPITPIIPTLENETGIGYCNGGTCQLINTSTVLQPFDRSLTGNSYYLNYSGSIRTSININALLFTGTFKIQNIFSSDWVDFGNQLIDDLIAQSPNLTAWWNGLTVLQKSTFKSNLNLTLGDGFLQRFESVSVHGYYHNENISFLYPNSFAVVGVSNYFRLNKAFFDSLGSRWADFVNNIGQDEITLSPILRLERPNGLSVSYEYLYNFNPIEEKIQIGFSELDFYSILIDMNYEVSNVNNQNVRVSKGCIYFRHEILQNLLAYYDFRSIQFKRWETSLGSGIYTEVTDPGNGENSVDFYTFANGINAYRNIWLGNNPFGLNNIVFLGNRQGIFLKDNEYDLTIQEDNIGWKESELNNDDFNYTTWLADEKKGATRKAIASMYNELVNNFDLQNFKEIKLQQLIYLRNNNLLIPGLFYKVIDFYNSLSGISYARSTNQIEKILVLATDTNKLSKQIKSIDFPEDIIFASFENTTDTNNVSSQPYLADSLNNDITDGIVFLSNTTVNINNIFFSNEILGTFEADQGFNDFGIYCITDLLSYSLDFLNPGTFLFEGAKEYAFYFNTVSSGLIYSKTSLNVVNPWTNFLNQNNSTITYRHDVERNLLTYYDFRSIEFKRWEDSLGSGNYIEINDPGNGEDMQYFLTFNDIDNKNIWLGNCLNTYLSNIIFQGPCQNIFLKDRDENLTYQSQINIGWKEEITLIINILYTNLLTKINNETLQPGALYYITDKKILIQAIDINQLAITGYYKSTNPNYNSYNIWLNSYTYTLGEKIIWDNLVYENTAASNLSNIPNTLIDWILVPVNSTDYLTEWDEVKYDVLNNEIYSRLDKRNNEVVGVSAIQNFPWGNNKFSNNKISCLNNTCSIINFSGDFKNNVIIDVNYIIENTSGIANGKIEKNNIISSTLVITNNLGVFEKNNIFIGNIKFNNCSSDFKFNEIKTSAALIENTGSSFGTNTLLNNSGVSINGGPTGFICGNNYFNLASISVINQNASVTNSKIENGAIVFPENNTTSITGANLINSQIKVLNGLALDGLFVTPETSNYENDYTLTSTTLNANLSDHYEMTGLWKVNTSIGNQIINKITADFYPKKIRVYNNGTEDLIIENGTGTGKIILPYLINNVTLKNNGLDFAELENINGNWYKTNSEVY